MKLTLATLLAGTLASMWLYRIGRRQGYEEHRRKVLGRLYEAVKAAGRNTAMKEDR